MIKPSYPLSISPRPYSQDIKNSLVRAHKYYRVVTLFDQNEDTPKTTTKNFLKRVKNAKSLKSFKLKTDTYSNMGIKLGAVKSVLKAHSQRLRSVDIAKILLNRQRNLLLSIKKLNTLSISNDTSNIRNLSCLKKLEKIFINIAEKEVRAESLYRTLMRLLNLRHVCLSVFPNCLEQVLSILNKFSDKTGRPVKFQILAKEDYDYNDSNLSLPGIQRITKLKLKSLNSCSALRTLFNMQPADNLLNLKNLRLDFSVPDLELAQHLRHLKRVFLLEKLSLSFTECWDTNFIEGFFAGFQLPPFLQELKLTMPLSFKNLMKKHVHKGNKKEIGKFPWRKNNFFEEEPLFSSFFQALEQAQHLRKVDFRFQVIETFNSYYTNFFVSVVNRFVNGSSLAIHVSDYTLQEDFTHRISQPFDLALFLQSCSRVQNLENLEIIVPNILFEGAEISNKMSSLKGLIIGITESEEDEGKELFKFDNISKCITGWLKKLLLVAPNLKSLVFDFTEVIDEPVFIKRFALIERFKNLEEFCSRFIISKCSIDTAKNVGKVLKSLIKLDSIFLKFMESDKNILCLRKNLHYHKTLRDVLISFDEKSWIGTNYEADSLIIEASEKGHDDFVNSALDEEAPEYLNNIAF